MTLRALGAVVWTIATFGLFAPAAAQAVGGPDCDTPDACVRLLREHDIRPDPPADYGPTFGLNQPTIWNAVRRLVSFGDAGVVAVLPLLDHSSHQVRNRAGFTLSGFETIDPRHLPRLRAAKEARRLPWLTLDRAPAGTDEELAALWQALLAGQEAPPDWRPLAGLQSYGSRAYPHLRGELELCRQSRARAWCARASELASRLIPLPPFVIDEWEAIARSPLASREVRDDAADRLVAWRHAYGLVALTERLARYEPFVTDHRQPPARLGALRYAPREDAEAARVIAAIGGYGPSGVAAGPALIPFVTARGLDASRTAAVRAMGQIGYRDGVPVIIAQAPDFDDNWALAYNSAEALGRLGAGVEQITPLAAHWYRPVRNNAERSLNLIRHGAFERPGIARDVEAPDFYTTPTLPYLGDYDQAGAACPAAGPQGAAPLRSGRLVARSTAVQPALHSPDAAVVRELIRRHPALEFDFRGVLSRVSFLARLGRYQLVGTNMGEFGGGVQVIGPDGRISPLLADNAVAAYGFGDSLLVATGLAHGALDRGDLWIIALGDAGPEVRRRIRLPSRPTGFAVPTPGTLRLTTAKEDVFITRKGQIFTIEDGADC